MSDDETILPAMEHIFPRWANACDNASWLVLFGMCHAWYLTAKGDIADDFDLLADVALSHACEGNHD